MADSSGPLTINRAAAKKRVDDAKDIPIFKVENDDGEEITYSVKDVPRAEIALRYLDVATSEGDDAGNYFILTETMGKEAYEALMSIDGLEQDVFEAIVDKVQKIVTPQSSPKGRRG